MAGEATFGSQILVPRPALRLRTATDSAAKLVKNKWKKHLN